MIRQLVSSEDFQIPVEKTLVLTNYSKIQQLNKKSVKVAISNFFYTVHIQIENAAQGWASHAGLCHTFFFSSLTTFICVALQSQELPVTAQDHIGICEIFKKVLSSMHAIDMSLYFCDHFCVKISFIALNFFSCSFALHCTCISFCTRSQHRKSFLLEFGTGHSYTCESMHA